MLIFLASLFIYIWELDNYMHEHLLVFCKFLGIQFVTEDHSLQGDKANFFSHRPQEKKNLLFHCHN
jgi:hypothetical protein